VDADMLARSKAWLLAQRDGKGGFERKRRALHTWVEDKDTSDAYIAWALLEAGVRDLPAEVKRVTSAGQDTKNSYVTALAANVAFLAGDTSTARTLLGALAARQDSIEHFRSYDFALDTRPAPDGARFVGWLHTTPARIREVAERTAEAGTWNVPTLVIEQAITQLPPAEPPPRPRWLPAWLHEELQADTTRSVFKPEFLQAIEAGRYRRYELLSALDSAGAPLPKGTPSGVAGAFIQVALPAAATVFRASVKGAGGATMEMVLIKLDNYMMHTQVLMCLLSSFMNNKTRKKKKNIQKWDRSFHMAQ
jgi:hypothetical protein